MPINPVDAVALLRECQPVAQKLLGQGSKTFLDKVDRVALEGFKQVKEAGWADNYDIRRLAGLSVAEVAALDRALSRLK